MARRGLAALGALALVCGLVLSACGNDGLNLARQACGYVQHAVRLYDRAKSNPGDAGASRQLDQAFVELQDAIPLAAAANSADPQWNPLMTTLQESRRNDLSNLIPALTAQCHQANLPNEQPPPFNSVPQGNSGAGGGNTGGSGTGTSSGGTGTSAPSSPSTIPNPKLP